jgi:hypothetical protein
MHGAYASGGIERIHEKQTAGRREKALLAANNSRSDPEQTFNP